MGEIITFYSYKGGTGRSMALANTACLVSKQTSGRVLMIDWDLEAPGLEHYFSQDGIKGREGIFEFIESAHRSLPEIPYEEDNDQLDSFFSNIHRFVIPVKTKDQSSNLFLIKAGNRDQDYAKRIGEFNWTTFYYKIPSFFPRLAKYLAEQFDYVFIDSRTGHTDIGGICTMILPEKLVLVFTPNEQSLSGVVELAAKATDYRLKSDDMRPLVIYPLPSKVDITQEDLLKEWKRRYTKVFEKTFQEVYGLPRTISLEKYFDTVQIRYEPKYAYGEGIAVWDDISSGPDDISNNYRQFVRQLTEAGKIWTNEPFAGLISPYQVFFVFAEKDRSVMRDFVNHIQPLARQKAVAFAQSDQKLISVEKWDEPIKRKIAGGDIDFAVVFISSALYESQSNWQHELEEMRRRTNGSGTEKIILILVEPVSFNGIFTDIPIMPNRKKPLNEWSDRDEVWLKIASDFRSKLINYHAKRLSEKQGTT
ncbi:MAG: hypothetical protein L6Q97_05655 [Thermoanaerobaculia bacterium]|nr:hypothetical protein [Thermoanaerobaculia bacterium]